MQDKYESFQKVCSQTFISLEQYKLKTNLLGCNMDEQNFNKYYSHFQKRTEKRLQEAQKKIDEINAVFQKNKLYLKALQLRTLNNLFLNYRKRMDLATNEPTGYNYALFQKQETDLLSAIVFDDISKEKNILDIMIKIKMNDQKNSAKLKEAFENNQAPPKFEKAIKTISRAEIRYFKYYQNFERSLANMVNQLHSHLGKLTEFYTVWENLGSSLIFELKSDRELIIDKELQMKELRLSYAEKEDEVRYMLQILPPHSKLRTHFEDKLKNIEHKEEQLQKQGSYRSNLSITNRNKKKSMRQMNMPILKANWYEGINNCKKALINDQNLLVSQKEDGFFRYTYEELHHETLEYLEELRNKELKLQIQTSSHTDQYFERFVRNHRREEQTKERSKQIHFDKYNVPPQMSLNCWYDRLGSKGYFNIKDFPANLVQKKLEYEIDRQSKMWEMDLKRKKEYNIKEKRMGNIQFEQKMNFGYKYTDSLKELQYLKVELTSRYDPEYLPRQKNKKQLKIKRLEEEFSDSNSETEKKQGAQALKIQSKREPRKLLEPEKMIEGKRPTILDEIDQIGALTLKNKKMNSESDIKHDGGLKIETREKIKSEFEKFVAIYLPQQQLIYQMKSKKQQETFEFKFIKNYNIKHLREEFDLQQITSCYLVNQEFFIKVEPQFFGNGSTRIKIKPIVIGDEDLQDNLKNTLQCYFSHRGLCLFQPIECSLQPVQPQNRQYFILGKLINDLKCLHGQKKKGNSSKQMIEEGRKKMEEFRKYLQKINK